MLIDPRIILDHFGLVLLLTLITIVGKIVATSSAAFLTGQGVNTSLRAGFSMAQIGEFSFIIVGLGLSLGAINSSVYPIIVAVSAITTFLTPYLIRYSSELEARIENTMPPRFKSFLNAYTAWVYRSQASSKDKVSHKKNLLRLILNGMIVAIIFILSENLIFPKMNKMITLTFVSSSLTWLCAMFLSSPFIWAMLTAFKSAKFTRENNPSRTLAFFLSFFIPLSEVSILSVSYFRTWPIAIFLIGVAVIFFVLLYKKLGSSYQWFENHLVSNLRVQSISQQRYEKLAPWDRHLVEITMSPETSYNGKTLRQLKFREKYGINVVAIQRGSIVIFAPTSEQLIQASDKLIILGQDEEIEIFREQAEKMTEPEPEELDLLASFSLKTILIEGGHSAINKSIRQWKMDEKIDGLIVGLERKSSRILNPKSETILQRGDLLMIVGER